MEILYDEKNRNHSEKDLRIRSQVSFNKNLKRFKGAASEIS